MVIVYELIMQMLRPQQTQMTLVYLCHHLVVSDLVVCKVDHGLVFAKNLIFKLHVHY